MRRDAVRLRSLRLPSCLFGLFVLVLATMVPTVAPAGPTLYPSSLAGWNAQVLDERDTAPYLAYHKAEAMRRQAARGALLGRATANQAVYDARFYDIDLTVNPSTSTITGSVLTRATVISGPLTTLDLDLDNIMTVSGVTAGGVAATFSHLNDVLTINLNRAYATARTVEVGVNYSGNPASGGAFGWDSYNGQTLIWTLSEPFGARSWWPCEDWSDDKADSVDLHVTVPTPLIVASNGTLREQSPTTARTDTYHWHEGYPISTYLVSMAIHPYSVCSD